MKSNTNLNSEMYSYAQTQLQHGKIKFLVDENIAKNDRAYKSSWKKKRASDRVAELQPYVMTTALREQMINLVEEDNHGGANIILKPANRKISHDRFSAMIYGLYYCKLEEEKAGAKQRDIGKFLFFSKC